MNYKKLVLATMVAAALVGCNSSNDDNSGGGNNSPDFGLNLAYHYTVELDKIGARVEEHEERWGYVEPQKRDNVALTRRYIERELTALGYGVTRQAFEYWDEHTWHRSYNLEAVKPGMDNTRRVIVGAHYDTVPDDHSRGTTDNGAGVAALLAAAKAIYEMDDLPYDVHFVFYGAEEIGILGSTAYVDDSQLPNVRAIDPSMTPDEITSTIANINLDTIAGGDLLWANAANQDPAAQEHILKQFPNANFETWVSELAVNIGDRLAESDNETLSLNLRRSTEQNGFGVGGTGDFSDHLAFYRAGIPIVHIEATDYDINGIWGCDGYTQTSHPALWTCDDSNNTDYSCTNPETNTLWEQPQLLSCDGSEVLQPGYPVYAHVDGQLVKTGLEQDWGRIWHTRFDNLDILNELMGDRVEQQVTRVAEVLIHMLREIEEPSA